MTLATIEQAIRDFQQGKMVIIVDDEDRENEGDLVIAAEFATPEAINFMAREACGLICIPMTQARLDALEIPYMVDQQKNTSGFGTGFTVSVEAATGVTTGISAGDRARTVEVLIDPNTTRADLATPGHMFPLRAMDGGVLVRRGQTEASVDLARLAGLTPAAVICEVMHEDGTMKRLPQLVDYAEKHDLNIISVEQLAEFRRKTEPIVTREAESKLPTQHGDFDIRVYADSVTGKEHSALIAGVLDEVPLVRIHSECLTGDVFGSARCDCGPQLEAAQRLISAESGIILYLRQEGRGIGLANKIKAYSLQDEGMDTVEANHALGFSADQRNYNVAAQMLFEMGITRVRLLTNNPKKVEGLALHGIKVVERVPHFVDPNPSNHYYLQTKRDKMAHQLPNLNGKVPHPAKLKRVEQN